MNTLNLHKRSHSYLTNTNTNTNIEKNMSPDFTSNFIIQCLDKSDKYFSQLFRLKPSTFLNFLLSLNNTKIRTWIHFIQCHETSIFQNLFNTNNPNTYIKKFKFIKSMIHVIIENGLGYLMCRFVCVWFVRIFGTESRKDD